MAQAAITFSNKMI